MARIVLIVLALVAAPTVAFFLWAWAVKIKEQRRLSGTLPEWQDLPMTWLGIVGLVCAIAGFIVVSARHDRVSALLFVPYLLWVGFATTLNGAIWRLN